MYSYLRSARFLRAPLAAALLIIASLANAAGVALQNVNFDQLERKVIVKGKLDGFAEPTTVTVRDLATGNVLGTRVTKKQFGFRINVPLDAAVPCAVLVTAGEHVATSEVRHAAGQCGSYTATLTGLVTDEPIPYATVTVTLGGVTYTTVADENGQFSLPIASTNLRQLVKIDASARNEETGDPIEFTNLYGSFSRVLDAEARNGSAAANVTNVTTASYVLVVQANGGDAPTTEEELRIAETSIDATQLLELAALIKLIVDNPDYSLPPGETSLIAFISDPGKVATYLETVPKADLDAAVAAILADSDLVAGFAAAEIPERYYSIPRANPGYLARQGTILEFDRGANTGRSLSYSAPAVVAQPSNSPYSWSVTDGRLVLDYTPAVLVTSFSSIFSQYVTDEERQILADAGRSQVQIDFRTLRDSYTRVTDGTLVDIVSLERRTEISAPPIPLPDGSTLVLSRLPQVEVSTGLTTMRSSVDIEPRPYVAACPAVAPAVCVPGSWGGLYVYSPGTQTSGLPVPEAAFDDLLTFTPGGSVSGVISGVSANWTVDADGALLITYPSGWVQRSLIIDTLGIEYGVFSEFSRGSDRFAAYRIQVKSGGTFELSDAYIANPPGLFWQGEVNSWIPGRYTADGQRTLASYFGWQFYEGTDVVSNVSSLEIRNCDGGAEANDVYANLNRGLWSLQPDGNLIIDRRALSGSPGFQLRSWLPVAQTTVDGDRQFYVIEAERNALGRLFISPRINYQREIGAPWVCSN